MLMRTAPMPRGDNGIPLELEAVNDSKNVPTNSIASDCLDILVKNPIPTLT
jgi:hypothetical protein